MIIKDIGRYLFILVAFLALYMHKSNKTFVDVVQNRRTYYSLSKDVTISDDKIRSIIELAVKHGPSSFNSQTSRVIILLGVHHDKLWESTKEILRGIVPADSFPATEARINGFKNGYGTALFFEDQATVKGLQEKFALYAEKFPSWSEQASGMAQFIAWAALEAEGLGANLQHYNPLIDELVQKEWEAPTTWKLLSQLVFGHPTQAPGEKQFMLIEERVKVFK